MTLKEYLCDYASEDTANIGNKLITSEVEHIPNEKVKGIVKERLTKIADGERDFRF
jgi:2-iminoacetate synthase